MGRGGKRRVPSARKNKRSARRVSAPVEQLAMVLAAIDRRPQRWASPEGQIDKQVLIRANVLGSVGAPINSEAISGLTGLPVATVEQAMQRLSTPDMHGDVWVTPNRHSGDPLGLNRQPAAEEIRMVNGQRRVYPPKRQVSLGDNVFAIDLPLALYLYGTDAVEGERAAVMLAILTEIVTGSLEETSFGDAMSLADEVAQLACDLADAGLVGSDNEGGYFVLPDGVSSIRDLINATLPAESPTPTRAETVRAIGRQARDPLRSALHR